MATTENATLDRETIARLDTSDLVTDVLGIPEHLRDALWKVESAGLQPWDSPGGLVVAGMGGSGIGGPLARAILGDQASRPLLGARAYGLPPWTTPDTTVLCASYSGNTEETLACYEAAGIIGARRVVVTAGGRLAELARADGVPVIPVAGGFQPRAAVAYMTVAALEVAALCGVGPRMNSEIDVAAEHLEELVVAWGPDGDENSEPKALARALHGTVPIITGAGLTSPIAYRWKTQVNENAKAPAYSVELPEADHNEIVGWAGAARTGGRHAAIHLADPDDPPTVRASVATTPRLIDDDATLHRVLTGQGQTRTARAFWLLSLLDHASVHTARAAGVDPYEIDRIAELKQALAAAG
jgi:glucose/mannose-6-phosphate isomerase